jgi:hypothetical protein
MLLFAVCDLTKCSEQLHSFCYCDLRNILFKVGYMPCLNVKCQHDVLTVLEGCVMERLQTVTCS